MRFRVLNSYSAQVRLVTLAKLKNYPPEIRSPKVTSPSVLKVISQDTFKALVPKFAKPITSIVN